MSGRRRTTLTLVACALAGSAGSAAAQSDVPEDVGYALGAADAPVRVIEFLDFGCSACREFAAETFPALRKNYIETGRVLWRAVPFVLGAFPNSAEAARAAVCADAQGAFWPMHDALFEHQREWLRSDEPLRVFLALARELQLDASDLASCYGSDAARTRVERQTRAARDRYVRATPTFFLDERRVLGALRYPLFSELLNERLERRP